MVLSKKQELFCMLYFNNGAAELSAKKAGYTEDPEKQACKLLLNNDVKSYINELHVQYKSELKQKMILYLGKIACGDVTDTMKIVLSSAEDYLSIDLDKMNLHSISEVKRGKDGIEIKFIDKIKIFDLINSLQENDNGIENIYEALRNSAKRGIDDKITNI